MTLSGPTTSRGVARADADRGAVGHESQAWPDGLREAVKTERDAVNFGAVPASDGTWSATNGAQGLDTSFSPAGVGIRPTAGGGWSSTLTLTGMGRPGTMAGGGRAPGVGGEEPRRVPPG